LVGTPYAVKVARTVWTGGKAGDNFKGLPICMNKDDVIIKGKFTLYTLKYRKDQDRGLIR
ncbi:hypothetical protein ABH968_005594, partial [Lysinibacillus sp. RC79]